MLAKPRIMASIVIAAILAMLVGAASSWAVGQFRQAAEARRHGLEVFESAVDLIASLQEAERSQLAYPLLREQALQASYLAAKDQAGASFERLRRLTRDRSALDHLEALVPLLESKFQEMDAIINLLQGQDGAFAQARLEAGRGQHLMEAIRGGVRAYTGVEKGLQAQTQAVFQSNLRRSLLLVTGAALLVVLLSVLYTWLLHREAKRLETKRSQLDKEDSNRRLHLALETLRLSEEKFAVTLEAIADAVIATDSEGRVTLLNPRAELLTGWCQAEALGRKVEEVFSILDQSTGGPSPLHVMSTLALGITQSLAGECILVSRDGSECPIADSCAPLRDRSGQVVGAVLVFRDVTAERAANQTVHDSTALIQTILNSVVDGIITLRASDTVIETINPAAARMFGYAPAELIGKSFSQLIPELDREQNNGFIEYYSASSKEQAGGRGHEVEGRRQDGALFPLEIAISDMRLAGKSYFTGVFRDITARKLAEDALLKGGALQNAIFNSANFSSIATDSRGVIQIFNVGAERMLGYRAAEVVNHITPADISDPEEVILRAKSLSRELETAILPGFEALVFKASRGIEDIYELTYIRKDGSRFPAVVSVTALRDDLGAIIGYLLIGTDNTARRVVEAEQRRLEQRLRDSQFYARSLFESNVDALMTTDPSGFITDTNKQMEALTGCTRDELIGAPFKSHFTDPDRADASIQLVLSEKKITNYELTTHARDGKETVVSFNATTFFDRDRNLQGVFGAARDVTEAKRLDLELLDKNVELESARGIAEKANQAKSEFLSSMSHELRSPLNAILGFAQLMESEEVPPTAGQQESLSQILRAGWHLLKLIDQILDLAKVESGGVPLLLEPVAMAEVLGECQSLIEHQAQQRGIGITFPSFDEPCFVRADHTRVKQVVINLLSNAIKYNTPQGRVDVTCREVAPGRVRVSIRDTGPGLSPQQLGQLFQAFNRLGQEGRGEEGTGIGLVVAKRLVELMGGAIGVDSSVGSGSEFWFELLADTPSEESSEAEPARASRPTAILNSGRRTVLYVEDNAANLMLVEQIIGRQQDLHLLTAATGWQGLQAARESLPDLILMDINLPDLNGFEVLETLRSNPLTAQIPVIALSANAMSLDIERALRAGFCRYLTKPIKLDEFLAAMEEAFAAAPCTLNTQDRLQVLG